MQEYREIELRHEKEISKLLTSYSEVFDRVYIRELYHANDT